MENKEIQGMNTEEQTIISRLLDIMEKQNMREQARGMEEITRYIVGMQVQLAMVTNELNGIKGQLGQIQMQNAQPVQPQNTQRESVQAINSVTESVQQFEEKTGQLSEKVSGTKTHLLKTASKAAGAFIEKGRHAMNRALQSGISGIRNRLQDTKVSLADTITAYANTAERINSAGKELDQLKQLGNGFADIGQILSGRDSRNLDKASGSLDNSLKAIQGKVSKKNESMRRINRTLAVLDKISDSLNASPDRGKQEEKTEKEETGTEKNVPETERTAETEEPAETGKTAEPPVEKQEKQEQETGGEKNAREGDRPAEPPAGNREQKENRESVKEAAGKQPGQDEKAQDEKAVTRIYLSLPPAGREEFRNLTAYLKANGAAFDAEKKAWYVTEGQDLGRFKSYLPAENRESVKSTSQYTQKNQYTPKKTGPEKAVTKTKIYLNLPSAGKEKFQKMTAYLKANGAAFDAEKKAWYVTERQDLNRFAAYLPTAAGSEKNAGKTVRFPVKETGSGKENRESVKNKLSQMQKKADEQNGQKEPQKEKKQEACL